MAGFVVVALAGAAGLRASDDQDAIEAGEYVFTLMLSAMAGSGRSTWARSTCSAGNGRFRLWALVLCPLLVAGMTIGNLALQVPEVQATDLACVLFALTVRPPGPGPRRDRVPGPG